MGKLTRCASTITPRSYIRRIASLTPLLARRKIRLSIPTVSVLVSLPLKSRNRIPVEYTTLYSSISRLSSTPSLLPMRFPRKPHQPPPCRIHLDLLPFAAATPTDLAKRARYQLAMCLFTMHTDSRVYPLSFFLLPDFFRTT